MISKTLKFYIVISVACVFAALLSGCANQRTARDASAKPLPLGLYKVVERECSYVIGAPEDCSRTQYIELVKGVFYGIGKEEACFVTWLSDNPSQEHDYIARDLRHGKLVNSHEFLVEDNEFEKEWFVVENGAITDYFFVRHNRQTSHDKMEGNSHLTLIRIPRNAEIDRLLPYPPED